MSRFDIKSKTKSVNSLSNEEDTFSFIFNKYCTENECRILPSVRRIKSTFKKVSKGSIKSDTLKTNEILICLSTENEKSLEFLHIKNLIVEDAYLHAIEKCLKSYNLTTLKLEYCNLSINHIKILTNILRNDSSIKELSLNGNPNRKQNFYKLLKHTKLTDLSLRFCEIDQIGAELLSNILASFEHSLLYLNLSSNKLGDDGSKHIAKIMRINRTLVSLNISDNKISDVGCKIIVESMQNFSLNHEETVMRRKIKYSLLEVIPVLAQNSSGSIKKANRKSKLSRNSLRGKSSTSSTASQKQPKKLSKLLSASYSSVFSVEMPQTNHPFINDSIVKDKIISCRGNYSLISLNIGYNNLSLNSLNCIIEMLKYQKTTYEGSKGILRLILKGNEFEDTCNEMKDIEAIISSKYTKSYSSNESLSSNNSRKRRISS